MQAQKDYDPYAELMQLPELLTGEILDGQLYTHPRPSGRHILIASNLGMEIGGPGGWWILQEPEVHFVLDREVVVPDIAGWRKENLPQIPESHKFTVVPEWICEVFSPSTEGVDREIKMPLYARYGVRYLWFVHPVNKTLDAYKLVNNAWQSQGLFKSGDSIRIEPFDLIELNIDELME